MVFDHIDGNADYRRQLGCKTGVESGGSVQGPSLKHCIRLTREGWEGRQTSSDQVALLMAHFKTGFGC